MQRPRPRHHQRRAATSPLTPHQQSMRRTTPVKPAAALSATNLRTNDFPEPLGIGDAHPELTWHLVGDGRDLLQTAFQVQVALRDDFGDAVLWDTGPVAGSRPFGLRYSGAPLSSSTRYWWRVRVWDQDNRSGGWSESASFETGIFGSDGWHAQWITARRDSVSTTAPIYLRGELELSAPVVRGRAYASALGWYRLFVNGADLTGPALVPRYTPYNETVEYQVYDVTDRLRAGTNVVAMAVADGRFRGQVSFFDRREVYGDRLAGFLQLELELADGTTVHWATDESWAAGPGRIIESDPKLGETVDLRVPDSDWLADDAVPGRFAPVDLLPPHARRLIAEEVPRVTRIRSFAPKTWRSPAGRQLVDLGQNLAGVLRIRLAGEAGTTVRLTFSEVLTSDGELDTDWIIQNPKKPWYQRDQVILDGSEQWWRPWFTIHGFRYVEIEGLSEDLAPDDVEGIALSSDLPTAGSFSASDSRLTQLWHNVHWSTRSNFTDTPTDCPTRERSGWTGDIQVFTPTATGMVDSRAFLKRYLRNLAVEQKDNGNVSPWIPSERSGNAGFFARLLGDFLGNSVGWGDAAVLMPWDIYRYYGDEDVLSTQYDSMRKWVDRLERSARRRGFQRWFSSRVGKAERYILDSGFHWGEWLRPGEHVPWSFFDGVLHGAGLATAYFEHSARLLSNAAEVLGHSGDAARYRALANSVRQAWRAAFVRDEGRRIGRDLQDDYVRAIAFDLLSADERQNASTRLIELIEGAGMHLGTGFLSTPMLLSALVDTGHEDVAFRLLLQDTAPSWLFAVKQGATTIWETWEGYDEHGRARESHNHYALGSVAGWMREQLAGITPLAPGYEHIGFRPVVGGGLTFVESSVETPYGSASIRWDVSEMGGRVVVTVPTGSRATVTLPDRTIHAVGSGEWTFAWPLAGQSDRLSR
ncbi:alpha-L-rhamnosidase [Microbacterium sp. W4I4]|uniref:alpha-L-rhamnosidase n=1 Tax=Microbacterium sp. W4I4 TaxID=3042295 RepID=UPI00277E28A1|nr:alpha-L-rhamnosidase [Microbacterium sp. W4I4]MDQ0613990.1 alpha-L-rhamnosidase [Microbacterium sp. W4I4]